MLYHAQSDFLDLYVALPGSCWYGNRLPPRLLVPNEWGLLRLRDLDHMLKRKKSSMIHIVSRFIMEDWKTKKLHFGSKNPNAAFNMAETAGLEPVTDCVQTEPSERQSPAIGRFPLFGNKQEIVVHCVHLLTPGYWSNSRLRQLGGAGDTVHKRQFCFRDREL